MARGTVDGRAFEARPTHWVENGETIVVWWLVEAAEKQMTPDSLRLEHERAAFLMAAANELTSLDAERCLDTTVRLAARHLADLALVIVPKAGRGHRAVYCGPDGAIVREDMKASPTEIPGVAEALQGFPPVPSRWIDPALVPNPLLRHGFDEPGSMVVTALPGPGTPVGALVLVRKAGNAAFSDGEESLTRQFAARAGTAMSAARLYAEQASITEILMRELLPPQTRDMDGVRLATGYRPSGLGEQVGGDFYDLFPAVDDGESLIVLGDVCGKGLEAAVLTGKIRNALQVLLPLARDHQQVLDRLNEVILLNGDPTKFVTLVLASVRHRKGRVWMRLTSAGHPPPLVLRANGEVEEVPTVGTLIGVIDKISTHTVGIELGPGETCLLHTDGVTEARGGPLGKEMFGDERLRAELAGCAGMPPDALVERVQMLARDWVGDGYHDDMAVIAITPRRERTPTEGKRDP
ncbi:PP2C family protein-serine/threonine phosphatase [Actinomadura barringtoniae]|uniref:PP2C family protein-serine/threonine phosphatase n=1 Tax=Actinomadura barringtoniae TaxID=1427535 RepID=UPI0027DC1724|nr:SpoIIE family protein phosphatase [Actinomadura barringtoniae]